MVGAVRSSLPSTQAFRRAQTNCDCCVKSAPSDARFASAFSSRSSAVATSSAIASLIFEVLDESQVASTASSRASPATSGLPRSAAWSLSTPLALRKAIRLGGLPEAYLFQASLVWARASRAALSAAGSAGEGLGPVVLRQCALELVGLLHGPEMRGGWPRVRDLIQRLAHQALGDVVRAFDEAPELLIDTVAQALRIDVFGKRLGHQRIEKRERHPPERPLRGHRLDELGRFNRGAHLLGSACVALEPFEQAALKPAALFPVVLVLPLGHATGG